MLSTLQQLLSGNMPVQAHQAPMMPQQPMMQPSPSGFMPYAQMNGQQRPMPRPASLEFTPPPMGTMPPARGTEQGRGLAGMMFANRSMPQAQQPVTPLVGGPFTPGAR
jgi:hypothetical protein